MDFQPRQRAVALAAALAAVLALSLTPAAHAAGFADGFGVRPIKRHGDELAPSYFKLTVKPGDTRQEAVVVSNSSDGPIEFLVDGVDGLTGTTSGVVYSNRDDRHLETSRWLRPSERRIVLAPGSSEKFHFTIRVPRDARAGDHLAGLAFQDVNEKASKSRMSVKQVLRVVMGVQLTVAGGSAAQIELGALKIVPLPGTQVPSVVLDLRNKGEVLCKPKARVVLTGPDGAPIAAEQQLDTILPGDEIAYPLPFKGKLAAGTYRAEAAIDGCGAHQRADVSATLASSLSGTTPMANPAPTVAAASPVPVGLLAGVGMAGLAGGGLSVFWALRRRTRPESEPQSDE